MIIVIINYNDHYRTTEILIVLYDSNIYIYIFMNFIITTNQ